MSELQATPGHSPVPTIQEVMSALQMLQASLGAFVQSDMRKDENGKAAASARAMGAYRKILTTYQALPLKSQAEIFGPIQALHETIVSLGIPLGPLRIEAPREPDPEPSPDAES